MLYLVTYQLRATLRCRGSHFPTVSPLIIATSGPKASLIPRRWNFGSEMSDNDPDIIEREKKKSLARRTRSRLPDAPFWDELLASESEAIIKAERSKAVPPDPCSLQQTSVEELLVEDADDYTCVSATSTTVVVEHQHIDKEISHESHVTGEVEKRK
ncbi:uncharacterized protein EV422DRAFT_167880 [Fimicolochytrium jonesii]|uniref:uncharacterized protein n=1 Tax=Fimicolochytrium jonesii TaxID=1396493 RepID=UPI0022FF059B|nr:uncharacterized protein EV422DRAFT_167880 [Fimicolochytrium jonesii]KAI8818469.1 hypothetical protein EV422DRAFT_167880 [Fimicolochytrium jonesii]